MPNYFEYRDEKREFGGSLLGLLIYLVFPGLPAIALLMLAYVGILAYLPGYLPGALKLILVVVWLTGLYLLGSLAYLLAKWSKLGSRFNIVLSGLVVGSCALYLRWLIFIHLAGHSDLLGPIPSPQAIWQFIPLWIDAAIGSAPAGSEVTIVFWIFVIMLAFEAISLLVAPAVVALAYIDEGLSEAIADDLISRSPDVVQEYMR